MEFINTLLDKVDQFFSLSPQEIENDDYPPIKLERKRKSQVNQKLEGEDLNSIISSSQVKDMLIVEPESFDEAQHIVDKLRDKQPILLNLSKTDRQVSIRIIDFISGAIYALGGNVEKVGESVFLFAPDSINITYKSKSEKNSKVKNKYNTESVSVTDGISKGEKESLYEK
ncbi:cell division inhibitor SepF [Orenia metallireducens]|jgi:cell division inhibitor SepF|uniref:Cell division protein SepF n=1 Tax=Orenia metallireducens TaxID=1413210 RepID=A0A285HQG3_9FIRM|nr:cell division protein SepF [Orenia metallireducens]PRX25076.1 cell division inhibitor SepF [Orenia metallireducens]SNY37948.1 cell division inhibitor SepF [Orenia metallireducens]